MYHPPLSMNPLKKFLSLHKFLPKYREKIPQDSKMISYEN